MFEGVCRILTAIERAAFAENISLIYRSLPPAYLIHFAFKVRIAVLPLRPQLLARRQVRIISLLCASQADLAIFMALAREVSGLADAPATVALAGDALAGRLARAAIVQLLFKVLHVLARLLHYAIRQHHHCR